MPLLQISILLRSIGIHRPQGIQLMLQRAQLLLQFPRLQIRSFLGCPLRHQAVLAEHFLLALLYIIIHLGGIQLNLMEPVLNIRQPAMRHPDLLIVVFLIGQAVHALLVDSLMLLICRRKPAVFQLAGFHQIPDGCHAVRQFLFQGCQFVTLLMGGFFTPLQLPLPQQNLLPGPDCLLLQDSLFPFPLVGSRSQLIRFPVQRIILCRHLLQLPGQSLPFLLKACQGILQLPDFLPSVQEAALTVLLAAACQGTAGAQKLALKGNNPQPLPQLPVQGKGIVQRIHHQGTSQQKIRHLAVFRLRASQFICPAQHAFGTCRNIFAVLPDCNR